MVRLNWTQEEMILAADFADDLDWRSVNMTTPGVAELSDLLRRADYHPVRLRDADFRSTGSVGMKVNNLRAWIPKVDQAGLRKSPSEWPVVESFLVDRAAMKTVAAEIRRRINRGMSRSGDHAEVTPETLERTDPGAALAAQEGGLRAVVSYHRERDPELRAAKLDLIASQGLLVECEVCTFNFGSFYGELGEDYIEVHHSTPRQESGMTATKLQDLVLLCANCHRMIHRSGWIEVGELKARLKRVAGSSPG
ncbi:HNH endonuclease [Brevibacterium sp. K72]|uniref:HNH endonuclease n=1 Tax=Brevibacterium sp. K72 TaxID=3390729 RepID=UPI001CE54AE9|nr:HNH endonuclease [Brevibacterium casei]